MTERCVTCGKVKGDIINGTTLSREEFTVMSAIATKTLHPEYEADAENACDLLNKHDAEQREELVTCFMQVTLLKAEIASARQKQIERNRMYNEAVEAALTELRHANSNIGSRAEIAFSVAVTLAKIKDDHE